MNTDGSETDVNFLIRKMEVVLDNILGSTALRDAEPALRLPFTILKPMPAALVPTLMTKRKTKLRIFQAWRKCAKQGESNEQKTPEEGGLFNQLQLSGRVLMSENSVSASLTSTFLVLAIDNQMVDACVAYYEEVMKCKEQLSQEFQEMKKQTIGGRAVTPGPESRRLQRQDTEAERRRFVMQGDFGFGCIRLCCSVNGRQLSTISLTNAHGKFEHQGGHLNSDNLSLRIEDVIVRPACL